MAKHPWLELENWAVVGATTNPHRYGNLIMKRLMENGYNTIPVTPAYDEVEGVEAFPSILDLEFAPDVVNFVVNPKIGKDVLVDCIEKVLRESGSSRERTAMSWSRKLKRRGSKS